MRKPMLRLLTAGATGLVVLANIALPAAAAACYQASEIEADQAIRYQTELMVLSDTCGGDTYRTFTVQNRDAIVLYQKRMIEHFRRIGVRNPQSRFDSLQTRLANEEALRNAGEPAQSVCGRAAAILAQARNLDGTGFKQQVATLVAEHRADYRRCRK